MSESYMMVVPLDQIFIDPKTPNVRGPVRDTTDLKESIRDHGLLHPLLVRQRPDKKGYYLVDGHRRLTALKVLRWVHVECVVKDISEDEVLKSMMLADVREHQPHVVTDRDGKIIGGRAWAVYKLIKEKKMSRLEVSRLTGIRSDVVGAYWNLFHEDSPQLIQKVRKGDLAITAYSRMKKQPREVKTIIASMDGEVTASQVRNVIARHRPDESAVTSSGEDGEDGEDIEQVPTIAELVGRIEGALAEIVELLKDGGAEGTDLFLLDELKSKVAALMV